MFRVDVVRTISASDSDLISSNIHVILFNEEVIASRFIPVFEFKSFPSNLDFIRITNRLRSFGSHALLRILDFINLYKGNWQCNSQSHNEQNNNTKHDEQTNTALAFLFINFIIEFSVRLIKLFLLQIFKLEEPFDIICTFDIIDLQLFLDFLLDSAV